jgi:hypothetical protein
LPSFGLSKDLRDRMKLLLLLLDTVCRSECGIFFFFFFFFSIGKMLGLDVIADITLGRFLQDTTDFGVPMSRLLFFFFFFFSPVNKG